MYRPLKSHAKQTLRSCETFLEVVVFVWMNSEANGRATLRIFAMPFTVNKISWKYLHTFVCLTKLLTFLRVLLNHFEMS